MALNPNALIDEDYFDKMWNGTSVNIDSLENIINAISSGFELFCNRHLKQRKYTFDENDLIDEEDNLISGIYYVPEYTIFDAPFRTTFWFPTYPVSEVTYFEISGNEISASSGYLPDDGYILNNRTGKLVYNYGFDYPYLQNIKTKWTGGYANDSAEMAHLKHLCFLSMRDYINSPQNMTYESERIGQYSYKTIPTYFLKSLEGLSPKVFSDLTKYRREAIG